jgi:hypothetical protein
VLTLTPPSHCPPIEADGALAELVTAWLTVPEALHTGIVAMVKAAIKRSTPAEVETDVILPRSRRCHEDNFAAISGNVPLVR